MFGLCLVVRGGNKNNVSPPVYMVLVAILYQIILFLLYYFFLTYFNFKMRSLMFYDWDLNFHKSNPMDNLSFMTIMNAK